MATDILRDYVDEESDELMLTLKGRTDGDGYLASGASQESLMLEILANTQVKVLAIMCERAGHSNLALAYVQTQGVVGDVVRRYTLKGARP
jgi:hypothetical protein